MYININRSAILTGLPQHQNGMYGLHNGQHHFQSFDGVQSLSGILKNHHINTGTAHFSPHSGALSFNIYTKS